MIYVVVTDVELVGGRKPIIYMARQEVPARVFQALQKLSDSVLFEWDGHGDEIIAGRAQPLREYSAGVVTTWHSPTI